ncbi:MAG: hypothetical protein F2563_02360 [Actinobacteria bacterium]|nr:hypothetical protein [Actinomycetota bacterium]
MADGITDIRQLLAKYGGFRPTTQKENIPYIKLKSQYEADLKAKFSKPVSVFYMTDTHLKIGLPTNHLRHIGKYIKDTKPDFIIHGGDLWDCESLCHHIPNWTLKGRTKPSLKKDLDCLYEGVQILTEESGRNDWHMTYGNHDGSWPKLYVDAHPELYGIAEEGRDEVFKHFGWTTYEFGKYVDFGGVDFIHIPLKAGKPMGGVNLASGITRDAIKDTVCGHTHGFAFDRKAKLGNDQWITSVVGGCTMPEGYKPDYVVTGTAWWHGVVRLEIYQGKIQDHEAISLPKLEAMYG